MNHGAKALRSQQLLLVDLVEKFLWKSKTRRMFDNGELVRPTIVIHHVTDTPEKLQLEIEIRIIREGSTKIKFKRIVL